MIYVDTSVVLAHVLAEDRRPPAPFWRDAWLVSSRLCELEAWVRMNAYGLGPTHGAALAGTLACVDLIELAEGVCGRCRAPFPVPVRTLDALHLSTLDFLRTRGFAVELATYDRRLREAGEAMGFGVMEP